MIKKLLPYTTICFLASGVSIYGIPGDHGSSSKLLGCWHLVASASQDPVEIEFKSNGDMIYAVQLNNHWSIIKLVYKVEGNTIISNQPSHPREERTQFKFQKDGTLILAFNGQPSLYHKGPKQAPNA